MLSYLTVETVHTQNEKDKSSGHLCLGEGSFTNSTCKLLIAMYKLMSLEVGLLVESLSTIRALERLGASVSEEVGLHVMFLNEKKNHQHISNKKNFANIKCRTSKKSMPHSAQMNGRLSLCFRMCCFSWL